MRFYAILNRLKRLEPDPEILESWPPPEGSLSYILYCKLGQPSERMNVVEMLNESARLFWQQEAANEAG